jgi:hypothetical protein
MAVERFANEVVKLTRYEIIPLALKAEGKSWVLHAKENETIGCSEPAIGEIVIENERNRSNVIVEDMRIYKRSTVCSEESLSGRLQCFVRRSLI